MSQKCQKETGFGQQFGERVSFAPEILTLTNTRMMPEDSVYGPWPASGEIDLAESRGNFGDDYSPGGRDSVISAMVRSLSCQNIKQKLTVKIALGTYTGS